MNFKINSLKTFMTENHSELTFPRFFFFNKRSKLFNEKLRSKFKLLEKQISQDSAELRF